MEILTLSAFVVGITQVLKMAFSLNTRYAPLVSILVAMALVWAMSFFSGIAMSWAAISNGLVAGLTACGLWSGVKTSIS